MFIAAHNGARIWGGAERATTRLLAGLQSRGHRVVLYCNRPVVADAASRMGVTSVLLPLGGDIALPDAARFAARLRRDHPDALIVGTYKKLFLASAGARMAAVPRVIARVGLETDVPRSWKYRVALRRWVDVVVVTAERMRVPFEGLLGVQTGRVQVIANAVVERGTTISKTAARERLGLPTTGLLIGSVARLDAQKRLDRLLRVLARLPDRVHAVLAGDGPERAAIEALVGALGIEDRVRLLGHREDTELLYPALDLLVVSSDREGMSNAMLEALAAGVPVVSTPVSGAEDALGPSPDGRTPGRVLGGFSEDELLAVVCEVLGDEAALRTMAVAAAEMAATRFSFDCMLDRWEALLSAPPLRAPLAKSA